jgi:photoactive yellow protein
MEDISSGAVYEVRCVWCQVVTRYSTVEGSSGLCQVCYERLSGHSYLHPAQIDELPFGLIELDEAGTVRAYNRAEAELARVHPADVLGRNFFTKVAPCTAVKEFQGRFQSFLADADLPELRQFYFTFHFEHGATDVRISMLRRGRGALLLVEMLADS